jgi:hypothetical protein
VVVIGFLLLERDPSAVSSSERPPIYSASFATRYSTVAGKLSEIDAFSSSDAYRVAGVLTLVQQACDWASKARVA